MSNSRRFFPEELDNLEAVMPVAAKDLSKVPYATDLLLKNTPVKRVHVVTDSPVVAGGMDGVVYHNERDVLPYGSEIFDLRPKWMYQQMIKLTQSVTAGKWYVSVDADTFVVSPIELWNDVEPFLFMEVDSKRIVKPYDRFNQAIFGYSYYPFSALNNIVLFNREIIQELMEFIGASDSTELAMGFRDAMGPSCYPAEAQLYLSWLADMEPNLYSYRSLRVGWRGMYDSYVFNAQQIEDTIREHSKNLDVILLHSWGTSPPGYKHGTYTAI